MLQLQPMDSIPDFTLDSVFNGKIEKFTLSSLTEKNVLILFYPVDFGYYQYLENFEEFKS